MKGTSMYSCRACDSITKLKDVHAREMMFGTREQFRYEQCAACGSLQIADIPGEETLSRHYPPNYYSFNSIPPETYQAQRTLKKYLRERLVASRDLSALGDGSVLGWLLCRLSPARPPLDCLAAAKTRRYDKIMDVGCGSAADLLNRLARAGFKNLIGIDPFIAADTTTPMGVKILKRNIPQVAGQFDLIMFHHSFEHVPDPRTTLRDVRKLLQPGGRCLIRIPTPSSEAYEVYGPDWVQLDAPRHLTLISRDGMKTLATDCSFALERVLDDSRSFQFTGSELYLKDIPLSDQNPAKSFDAQTLKAYDKRSKELNLIHRGDQAAFILRAV